MASPAIMAVENARLPECPAYAKTAALRTSAALQIGASLLWVPQAALIAVAIGEAADKKGTEWITPAVIGILGIGVLRAFLEAVGKRLAFRAGRQAATHLRNSAISALAARSPIDIDRPEAGKAASVIAEQAEMIVPFVSRFEVAKVRAVFVPGILFLFVLSQSWAAALVLLIAAPLIPIFMMLIGWRAKAASQAQLAQTGDMNAFLLDRLRGLATIRALDAVDMTAKRLRSGAELLRHKSMAVLRIAFLSSAVLELFSALGVAMVAVYVGFHLLGQITFGTWGAPLGLSLGLFILLLAPAFFEPLRDLSSVWHDRASGRAAIDALGQLVRGGRPLPGADEDPIAISGADPKAPSVFVDRLSFRHTADARMTFDRLRFSVMSGEHVALLGASGAGKSTLLALLAGLALPTSGTLSIGDQQLTDDSAARIRSAIAWIGQRPHIFAGTLAGNVRLGRDADPSQVMQALKFAHLDGIAQTRAQDPIGESGIGLSGGEALRLAISRIALQPNVGLILADEPSAHLDTETSRDVIDGLLDLARGKTMIVATHDMAVARRMDRIIHLDMFPLDEAA